MQCLSGTTIAEEKCWAVDYQTFGYQLRASPETFRSLRGMKRFPKNDFLITAKSGCC